MQNKLLLRVKLPTHRIIWRKSLVLPMLNIALNMNHWARKKLHDDMTEQFIEAISMAYKLKPFAHMNNSQYRITIGYYRGKGDSGKKTKTLDADGLSYIGKVSIDSLIKVTPIPNDCIFNVPEFRCIYLGEKEEEEIWLQVTRDEPEPKYIVIGKRYPDSDEWCTCKDAKTGGHCVVHRELL